MEFELWLDESGTFADTMSSGISFIGGLLLKKATVDNIDFDIVEEGKTHANELSTKDKQEYLLPALEYMKEAGAIEVFFEDADHEDQWSSRDLYLHIMAEGLLQLLQWLDAKYESAQLEVFIASRLDEAREANIDDAAYRNALTDCMREKRYKNLLFFHEQTSLQFTLGGAGINPKLQLADFACFARHARYYAYYQSYQDRIDALYDDAFIFSFSEKDTDNYIQRNLAVGNIANAVIELYSNPKRTYDNWRKEQLRLIIDHIMKNGYRYALNQLDQIVSTIETRLLHEDDYEYGEALCRELLKKDGFLDLVLSGTTAYEKIRFIINLRLSEMYTKEGDIISAGYTLKKCEDIYSGIKDTLENISCYYDLQLAFAEYEITSFQASRAVKRLKNMCSELERQLRAFADLSEPCALSGLHRSVNLGKAVSMLIKAMMAAHQTEAYSPDEIIALFSKAEFHLSGDETELEKLSQIRCYYEQAYSDHRNALQWLIQAKYGEECETKATDEAVINDFLSVLAGSDDEMNRKNYLFYYLSVIERAATCDQDLADTLFEAFCCNETLLHIVLPAQTKKTINKIDLSRVQKKTFARVYHPTELIYWKTGKILNKLVGEKIPDKVKDYYQKAVKLCYQYGDYHAMRITGLGIQSEYIGVLSDMGLQKAADAEMQELEQQVKKLQSVQFDQDTRCFLQKVGELVEAHQLAETADLILSNRF